MSFALLRRPYDKNQDLADDLEAFFWVLIYHVLRFRPTVRQIADQNIYTEFCELFDQYSLEGESEAVGGRGKQSFINNTLFTDRQVDMSVKRYGLPEPLAGLIGDFRSLLASFYHEPEVDLTVYHKTGSNVNGDGEAAKRRIARQQTKAARAAEKEAKKQEAIEILSSHAYLLGELRSTLSERSQWLARDCAVDYLPDAGRLARQ